MKILWDERAWEEYLEWQTQDKKTLKRINMLIKDIQRECYGGIGKPEPLKNNLSGWWDFSFCIICSIAGGFGINTEHKDGKTLFK